MRGIGQGFTYNLGRGLGAFIPFVVGALSKQMGLGVALGVFGGASYAVMAVAAYMLPETKGKVLEP